LEKLRASKHEEKLQRQPPKKRRRAKKAAYRRSDVDQEQINFKKKNLESNISETKEEDLIKEKESKGQVEESWEQERNEPKALELKSESKELRQQPSKEEIFLKS
jgi:hypothetical protein